MPLQPNAGNPMSMNLVKEKFCSGAILAGGASSRMGENKALMQFHGEPLIVRVAKTLTSCPAISEVLLITNTPAEYKFLQLPSFSDLEPGKGPLGGIYTALSFAKFSRVLVLACDLPFITTELLDYLCTESEGVEVCVPESAKGVEPLCAVYVKSCLPVIDEQLRENRLKVSDFYSFVKTKIIRLDASLPFYKPNLLANVNTPEDFSVLQSPS